MNALAPTTSLIYFNAQIKMKSIMNKTLPVASFIDSGKLKALFDHIKNLVIFSFLLALGTSDLNHQGSDIFGIFPSNFLGFGVIGLASILIILNLYDGIRRLAKLEHHKLLTFFLILLYVVLTIRVVQVAWFYRVS